MATVTGTRLPTYFISHGGGPWPWIKDRIPGDLAALEESLRAIPKEVGAAPRALLVVSAHWVCPEFTVQTHPNPPMLYDYGGFPEFTYHIEYPAPGAPQVAERAAELMAGAGIAVLSDDRRGFDHGVFAPMFVSYPDADVPIVQLSIKDAYDPADHLAAGRALAPLRDEGILIIGSGLTYHNLGDFGPTGAVASREFDHWLTEALVDGPLQERTERLLRWDSAPSARHSHPSEDHLIPLMVAVGAAEHEPGAVLYHQDDFMGSVASSSFRFGSTPSESVTGPGPGSS